MYNIRNCSKLYPFTAFHLSHCLVARDFPREHKFTALAENVSKYFGESYYTLMGIIT